MSDYYRLKLVRYPISEAELQNILKQNNVDERFDLEDVNNIFHYSKSFHFNIVEDYYNKTGLYLDYTLHEQLADDAGDFGRARFLTEEEQNKYEKIFKQVIEDVDKNKLKYVDYTYYNGVDAPVYYADDQDDFYNQI